MVAGSNPAVPTFCCTGLAKARNAVDTINLILGVVGFFAVIAVFFFGGYVLLDFLFSRSGGDA